MSFPATAVPGRRWRSLLALAAATALVSAAVVAPHDRRLQAGVLLALLFALWRVGSAMAAVLRLDLPRPSRIVAVFTLAIGFGSVAVTLLGHCGALRAAPFLLVVAAALLASLGAPAESIPTAAEGPAGPSLRPVRRGIAERVETVAAAATAGALALGYVVEALRRFALPLRGGPDDLSYHLTAIAVWQRWGDLRMVKFSMGDWGTAFYPILPEISSWMLLAPFRDSDVVARWSELPFALASLVAVAAVARRLGVGRRSALLAAALYGAVRLVATLAFAAGNDHVTAFFTLAALDAALAAAERPRLGRFAYLGTALGLLVASKYMGVYNAVTVLVVFAVAWALRTRRPVAAGGARPRAALAVVVLLGTLALAGGYTYLRNWVSTGNPVYPQPVRIAGLELFAGRAEMSLGARRVGEEPLDYREFLAGPDNEFAGFFPFTLLPAALLAPLWAAAGRRWLAAVVLALPAAFFFEFVYLTWDHRSIRYVFVGAALAAVAFVWLSERLGTVGAWLRTAIFVVVLFRYVRWLEMRGEWELLAAALLIGGAALGWRLGPRRLGWARTAARPLAALAVGTAVLATMLTLGCNVERYQRVKLADSPAALALERLVGNRGATVGYVGLNQPYLFFGSRLQNDVRIVPRSVNQRAEHYRWGGPAGRPLPHVFYRRWLSVVEKLGIGYVVVVRSPDEDPERAWMAHNWARFRRVHVDGTAEIWRLLPRPAKPPRKR